MDNQQDIKKQLANIGEIIEVSREDSTLKPKQRPIESQPNIMREKPPLVIPNQYPDSIMAGFMDYRERNDMIKFLIAYQKTRPDWDTYRQKIPDELLEKWAIVLKKCRINGFVNPYIDNNTIRWRQILGFKRNYKAADKCTVCGCSERAGDCKGIMKFKNQQRFFKPCWEGLS